MSDIPLSSMVNVMNVGYIRCLCCSSEMFGDVNSPLCFNYWINHYITQHPADYGRLNALANMRYVPVPPIVYPTEPPSNMPTILLGVPIRNDEVSLRWWWKCLLNQNYPKNKINIHIIEDNSSDNSMSLLEEFKVNSPFNSFTLVNSEDLPCKGLREVKESKPAEVDGGVKFTRVHEWNDFYNSVWFGYVKRGEADVFTQIHGDILAHPDTLLHHVTLFDVFKDCGVAGSGGMARGGRFGAPWVWRRDDYVAEFDRVTDAKSVGNIARCSTLEEIKVLPPLVKAAFCGGCFSVNKAVITGGCKYGVWPEETMAVLAVAAVKLGYYCYMDRTTQFLHVNHDGSADVSPHYDGWFKDEIKINNLNNIQ